MPRGGATTWSAEDDKTLLKAVQEYQDRGKKLNWVAIHEDHLSHMDFKKQGFTHRDLQAFCGSYARSRVLTNLQGSTWESPAWIPGNWGVG